MIVHTPFPPAWPLDALTVWPCVFVRPEQADNQPLLAHEAVHLEEQARWLVLPWWLAYLVSRRFRYQAELRAYRVQIHLGGITVERAAELLQLHYRLGDVAASAAADLVAE